MLYSTILTRIRSTFIVGSSADSEFPCRWENEPEFFYRYHRRFNELIAKSHADNREAASLFYYLNRML